MLSILVYPLQSIMTRKKVTASKVPPSAADQSSFGISIVTVAIPTAAIWCIGVCAQRRFVWGLASGMWVGLYCACATLKITSFYLECTSVPVPIPAPRSSTAPSTTAGVQEPAAAASTLTFPEYLFFLFLSPSLVCDVRLMKASSRRPSRPLRAASEFFHAFITFLVVHCVTGVFMAPSLRLFIAGVRSSWLKEGVVAEWTALDAAGGGGWPSWSAWSEVLFEEGDGSKGLWVILACFLWLLVVVSSTCHFLVFYAFWHCVCLGMAELFGFPDRFLYGETYMGGGDW